MINIFKHQKPFAKNDQKALAKNEMFSKFKICNFLELRPRRTSRLIANAADDRRSAAVDLCAPEAAGPLAALREAFRAETGAARETAE